MKILIYGAGVLGSLCAARLTESGQHQVSLLARGERLAYLRQNGIVLEHAVTGQRTTVPVNLVEQLNPQDVYDLVIIIMGRHQVPAVLPILAANQGTPNILFMGNNATEADDLTSTLGHERVLLGFYMAGGSLRDGVVWYADNVGERRRACPMGEVSGSITPRLKSIGSVFESSGIPVMLSTNIVDWLKTHAATILPLSAAYYRSGGNLKLLAQSDSDLALLVKGWKEAIRVLKVNHITILPATLKIYSLIPAFIFIPIMKQALRNPMMDISFGHGNKARPEMRQLATDFAALAKLVNLPTPALDSLFKDI